MNTTMLEANQTDQETTQQPIKATETPLPPQKPAQILSDRDEAKFQDCLVKNSQFRIICKTKQSREHVFQFPRYFGTNEDEFNVFRRVALRNRRLLTNEKYPEEDLQQQQKRAQKVVRTKTIDSQSNGQAKKTNNAVAGTPMKWSSVVQGSLPAPKSNGVSNGTKSAANGTTAKVPASASQPVMVMDNSLKPLGVVLLRIMYDKQLLSTSNRSQSPPVVPHGLINTGSICYMNSVLQLLFACEPFTKVLNIIRQTTLGSIESKTPILDAVLTLHESFIKKNAGKEFEVLNPLTFYTAISRLPRFSHLKWGRQEDAEEFLGYLLDGLHEEFVESVQRTSGSDLAKLRSTITNQETADKVNNAIELIQENRSRVADESEDDGWLEVGSNRKLAVKRAVEVKPSPIVQLFGGQFRSVLQVPNNKKSSITLDPFMHVQLDISDAATTDLITAFDKFSEVEEISYGNQAAKKQNSIDKLPLVLIIHLKRFSFVTNDDKYEESDDYEVVSTKQKKKNASSNLASATPSPVTVHSRTFESGGRIEKLHKIVKYTHDLTLPSKCISANVNEEPRYKLTGVVYHHGRSTEEGHYTADVLDSDNEWNRIDDTLVSRISENDVVENGIWGGNSLNNSKSAYILMYRKVGSV